MKRPPSCGTELPTPRIVVHLLELCGGRRLALRLLTLYAAAMSLPAIAWGADAPREASKRPLSFIEGDRGAFVFDTGVLRGQLRREGKSLGLSSVTHIKTGVTLDRSNGLFSHYRVFTKGVRYGGGAWDWPSTPSLRPDGSVAVHWPEANGRPFTLTAVYRWSSPESLDLETSVRALADLKGFESFLASYFDAAFTNVLICAGSPAQPFIPARQADGDWQMYPRDETAIPLIQDGRWTQEPNPVAWTLRPRFSRSLALRRAPSSGVTVLLMASGADCFAIATPHETEAHYSLYLSLFGRDLRQGETATARTRLTVLAEADEAVAMDRYRAFQP